MDRRQLLFGMTALALESSKLSSLLQAQISETASWLPVTSSSRVSDREKRGLRGPVRMCIGDDESSATEYDLNGNILSERGTDSRGKWSMTWAYAGDGRLLNYTWSGSDGSTTEQIYSYDETGRLVSITDSSGDRTDFRYDKQGRKMSVQSFAPKPHEEREGAVGISSVSGSVFELAQSGFRVPEGGSVTMLFNDHDQPTEVQIRDDKGSVVSRVIRTYGANGQPSEEKEILENLAPMFLDKLPRANLSPAQIKAMNKGLITMMGGGGETSYTYDAQNRIRERHLRILFFETVTTIAYNDHGDIVEERTTSIRDSTAPKGVSFSIDENGSLIPTYEASEASASPEPLPETSEVRYTYQYDSHGNWTEKTLTRSDGFSLATRRQLTYY